MKKLTLSLAILAVGLIGLAVNSTAITNCQTRLMGNEYLCQAVDRFGAQGNFSLFFGVSNESSFPVEFEGSEGTCGCEALGSLRRPILDRSQNFICAVPFDDETSLAMTGRASSDKIRDGQLIVSDNSTNFQLFYECIKMVP